MLLNIVGTDGSAVGARSGILTLESPLALTGILRQGTPTMISFRGYEEIPNPFFLNEEAISIGRESQVGMCLRVSL